MGDGLYDAESAHLSASYYDTALYLRNVDFYFYRNGTRVIANVTVTYYSDADQRHQPGGKILLSNPTLVTVALFPALFMDHCNQLHNN